MTANDMDSQQKELSELKERLRHFEDRQRTTRENFFKHATESDKTVRYFTGMPWLAIFYGMLTTLTIDNGPITYWRGPSTQERRRASDAVRRVLTETKEYLLTLIRIRLGLDLELLGYSFGIHASTASRIFITWVNVLYSTFQHLIVWPERAMIHAHMPPEFKARYPNTRVIIDCMEFETQRPLNTQNQTRTYSQYKGRNTCKALVGLTPNGAFSFVSEVWSGNISDRQITFDSGFLDYIEEGDEVMADRGFTIRDLLLERNAKLNIPPFTRACPQRARGRKLSSQEIRKTREIATLRIHVERAIGRMKTFRILSNNIDVPLRKILDQIIAIAAVISNLQGPLIRPK